MDTRMRVTINGLEWWRALCMRKGDMWRRCRQQADDRWEKITVDGKGNGEEEACQTSQSKLSHAKSQCDDPPNNETCSADLAELWQHVVECGKEDVVAEYDGRNVSGALNGEQEAGNINRTRGGLVRIVLNDWAISELEESSGAEKDLGGSWWWLVWKVFQRRMAAPSFWPEGRRQGGCHCRKCTGRSQQENKGKEAEETQSIATGSGSLAEHCFVAKNLAEECRIMVNLEKTIQVTLSFAGGGEELDNSPWIIQILLGRMIRERMEIGKAIKALVKFQRREIMRGLVKLGDLEDLVDPPTLSSYATLSLLQRLQNMEILQCNAEDQRISPSGGYLRPEDSPLGIFFPGQNQCFIQYLVSSKDKNAPHVFC